MSAAHWADLDELNERAEDPAEDAYKRKLASLAPCPFCGAGETGIQENGKVWLGMRWGEPSSVSVRHWCPAVPGQPSRIIERVGRDEASAIAAWNMRAAATEEPLNAKVSGPDGAAG